MSSAFSIATNFLAALVLVLGSASSASAATEAKPSSDSVARFLKATHSPALFDAVATYGFFPFSTRERRLPAFDTDQVFFDQTAKRAIFLRFGFSASVPRGTLRAAARGHEAYESFLDGVYGIYLVGFDAETAGQVSRAIRDSLGKLETARGSPSRKGRFPALIREAKAADCVSYRPAVASAASLAKVQGHVEGDAFTRGLMGCLEGALDGVYDATVGAVKDTAKQAWELITDPAKFWNGVVAAWDRMVAFVSDLRTNLVKMAKNFGELPGEVQAKMACSFVSSIGTGVLIGFLLGGSTLAPVLARFQSYVTQLLRLDQFFTLLARMGKISFLRDSKFLDALARGKISERKLAAIEKYATHQMDDFAVELAACAL
jgi:hypothetical protein